MATKMTYMWYFMGFFVLQTITRQGNGIQDVLAEMYVIIEML